MAVEVKKLSYVGRCPNGIETRREVGCYMTKLLLFVRKVEGKAANLKTKRRHQTETGNLALALAGFAATLAATFVFSF